MAKKKIFSDVPGFSASVDEMVQKLPLAAAVIDLDRHIVTYNRAFFLMAGREVRQGTPFCYEFLNFDFCHKDCLAHMATRLGRTITWDESEGKRKNGDELIVRPTVVPMKDAEGNVQGHILVFQNTTDEVHLYRNFRANLDHLERKVSFLQTLNEAADQFRKIKQVDALLERVTEFAVQNLALECCQLVQEQEEEYIAVKTFHSPTFPIEDDQKLQLVESILPGIETLNAQNMPFHIQRFDQVPSLGKQLESVLLPIRSGTSDYGYLVVHQFTQAEADGSHPLQQPAEAEGTIPKEKLEYLELFAKSVGPYIENCDIIANLESIVAERTRQLQSAQAQLMESTRLASVGEIAGMVAHEVLNPMTAVLARIRKTTGEEGSVSLIKLIADEWQKDLEEEGMEQLLEILKEIPEDGDMPLLEEDLANIRESADELTKDMRFLEEQLNRIVSIVDNLRGLSRAQNKSQRVDVREAVEKTAELTHDGLVKRSIELKLDFLHNSVVYCDLNELIQVIHNLVRNAMQAIERNGTVTISTRETTGRVEIRVTDSGPGIPPDIVPKIFEMRFTTKTEKEGTGLGLNLSRRLMRQVLGDVELETGGGSGTGATFLCWIPKEKAKS